MQICHFNIFLVPTMLKILFYLSLNFQNSLFLFLNFFKSLELIKYVLLSKHLCHSSDVKGFSRGVKNQTISS
jgi:hypothetical protein